MEFLEYPQTECIWHALKMEGYDPTEYMYMYSKGSDHFFKHINWRNYITISTVARGDPLSFM